MRYYVLSWIVYAIASVAHLAVVYSFFSSIFKRRYNTTIAIGVCVALILINLLALAASNAVMNMTISIVTLVGIALLFTGGFLTRIVFAVFLMIAGVISEFIVAYIFTAFRDTTPVEMQFGTPEFVYGLMLSRTQFAIMAIVISRAIIRISENRRLPKLKFSKWLVLVLPPIGSLFVLYNFMFQRTHSNLDIVASIIVMVTSIIVITVYGKILSDYEVEVRNQYLEELVKYYHYQYYLVEKSEKIISKTKHDIKNLLIGFQAGIQSQNVEDVQNGISELLGEIDSFDGPAKSGNLAIDSIINYKAAAVKESRIHFSLELNIPHTLKLDSVAICQIIGSALDNAIEASERIDDADKRIVEISVCFKHNTLMIQVTNPYEGDIITNSKGNIMSTKRNHYTEGIGLQSIESLVAMKDGVFDIDYKNNKFSLCVMLYNIREDSD